MILEAKVITHLEHKLETLLGVDQLMAISTHSLECEALIPTRTLQEILHTIPLGIVKYFWTQTVCILNKGQLL